MVKPFVLSPAFLLAAAAAFSSAQTQNHVVGYVPVSEATASNVLAVSGGKNLLGGASVVTALDHPAHLTLARGGAILVCQTSVVHLTQAERVMHSGEKLDLLLLSLDRGAMEIRMPITPGDVVMTPDLRFASANTQGKPAPLDLAMRVAPNGDTCLENRGKKSPLLNITDSFGESAYQLKSGQHVLFEHGSLKEVVDSETSPCGCPPEESPGMSLADAAVRGGGGKSAAPGEAAKDYPFPAAVSEGLAKPSSVPAESPGETHVQVASSLTYDGAAADPDPASLPASVPAPSAPSPVSAQLSVPPASPKPGAKAGVFHSIGHLFQKIFAR